MPSTDVLHGIATWGLQYTPRVAVMEASAVALELAASTRLFGGKRQLVERVKTEAVQLGVPAPSWAPTSLAALVLARAGVTNGFGKPLDQVLDAAPLQGLTAARLHEATLSRLGCQTLGDVRALPRGGLSRRFDAQLLAALDQAYGLRPESHAWVALPDRFAQRLELMSRVELAPALLFGARRLLLQLCGWLAARRSGVTAITLRWCHDVMRSKTAGDGGEVTVRTAEATRNVEHLGRLLAEHLAKVTLKAPAGDLELVADEVHALEETSAALLPDPAQAGESLALVLERVAARLGPERVLRPVPASDHRMEWMAHWQPAAAPLPRSTVEPHGLPQPGFLLPQPLKLALHGDQPMYQGPLMLLSGPHRV
ncbi:MAG: DNA polymerase Y family protein, partial [Comamonadaceae bacterium]